ncbi:MAG: hypothetical protein KKD44_29265 [Proteobacteria bacterium]|nr:hypothetical protein [Pseudomonadota bacterium]
MAVPKYHSEDWWALTGTAEDIRFLDMQPFINEEGTPMIRFYFEPNQYLVKKYNLKPGDEIDEKSGLIVQSYPEDWVQVRQDASKQKRVVIDCDLLGRQTKWTSKDIMYRTEVDRLRRENRTLRVALQRAQSKFDKFLTSPLQYFKEINMIRDMMEKKTIQPQEKPTEIQSDDANKFL